MAPLLRFGVRFRRALGDGAPRRGVLFRFFGWLASVSLCVSAPSLMTRCFASANSCAVRLPLACSCWSVARSVATLLVRAGVRSSRGVIPGGYAGASLLCPSLPLSAACQPRNVRFGVVPFSLSVSLCDDGGAHCPVFAACLTRPIRSRSLCVSPSVSLSVSSSIKERISNCAARNATSRSFPACRRCM